MAMRVVNLMLLLLASTLISAHVGAQAGDEAALLAFKAAAVTGGSDDHPLALWNGSTGEYCSWEGVRCRGRHRRVVALHLPSRGLNGVLSPAIGNLSSLRTLNLSFNEFSGDISASLGRLRRLHVLDLSHNTFTGKFPINLTSCINLATINLDYNQLHGRLPTEIGDKLKGLRSLVVLNNSITSAIPASLGNLSSLLVLDLAFNQLEGTIPPSLGGIQGLRFLGLGDNNLSGEPPLSLYNLSSLQVLQLHVNMLHGELPANIGSRFPSLWMLSFAQNQFTGSIPNSVSNLTTLMYLQLQGNRLSGCVPRALGRLRALLYLSLYDNTLEADDGEGWEFITSLPNCSQLQVLDLFENTAFTGQLPSSIANLSTSLKSLRFDATGISGRIPSAISNLINLQVLGLQNTSISGVIPESIGKLGNLDRLGLFNTDLSGLIPSSIGNLTRLTFLEASDANLEGPIPASLGNMKNLLALDLSMNHLNGSVPEEIFKLLTLSSLNLSYNLLSGPLPSEFGSLRNLNFLSLNGNQLYGDILPGIGELIVLQELLLVNNSFQGSIPQSLGNIKGLTALSLSMNKLSGSIPDGIGNIRNLQQLYLAHNNLSGPIPMFLQNLTSLSELDLSFNNLQGEVPIEGIFRNLANVSITGNTELCGGMPQLHLPPCRMNSEKINRKGKFRPLKISLSTIAALLLLAFITALIQLTKKKLRRKQDGPFPPLVKEDYERVSYHALANGTDGFSRANLLGEGSFGAVYKCTFQDKGTIVAVKVFNLEQSGSTRSFVAECEALRRVRHRSLLKIITCCSSINHQGQEFKALVFEFMPNGNLNDWLHPQSGTPTLSNTLSLAQRLDIAADIVDALDHLHNHCEPPIVHCDVKPSNILLAEDMSARIGDFGISRILPQSAHNTLSNSNSTIGIRGSIGYVAPEYGEGSSISIVGDVYSLGILLLEMFTGLGPTNNMFRDSLDLHKFCEDALQERIWEIADTAMWLHTDIHDSTIRSRIEDCMLSIIALAISCSEKQPKERIPIQRASLEMHAIRDSYKKFARSLVVEHRDVATAMQ